MNEFQEQRGSIVPEPLITLAVAIAAPAIVLMCLVDAIIRWVFGREER